MDPKNNIVWTNFGAIVEPIFGAKIVQKRVQKWDNFWKPFWKHLEPVLGVSWGPESLRPAKRAPGQGLGGVRGGLLSLYILLT